MSGFGFIIVRVRPSVQLVLIDGGFKQAEGHISSALSTGTRTARLRCRLAVPQRARACAGFISSLPSSSQLWP
jgi:hypothetical protein